MMQSTTLADAPSSIGKGQSSTEKSFSLARLCSIAISQGYQRMYPGKRYSAAVAILSTAALCAPSLWAQERQIDPTYLYRDTNTATEKPSDITSPTCHYKPLFGLGAPSKFAESGVVRYGEAVIDPGGSCAAVQYPDEDQIYVVLDGSGSARYGTEDVPLKAEDYLYIPATVSHTLSNKSAASLTVIVMGYSTKGYVADPLPSHPLTSNIEDVPTEFVGSHPDSSHFRLLLGDAGQKRDRIDAGRAVTSLFVMEIDPGGTNFPHHHLREEEIYMVLTGHGDIVAGSGADGVAGKYPAKPGDTYFYRDNATVGYYSAPGVKSRLLCIRSWFPGLAQRGTAH
jgi:mannose-6-phosphate isomerase-like protein (cupin superfamily)